MNDVRSSWARHPLTKNVKVEFEKRIKNAITNLQNKAKVSIDPEVRAAYAALKAYEFAFDSLCEIERTPEDE